MFFLFIYLFIALSLSLSLRTNLLELANHNPSDRFAPRNAPNFLVVNCDCKLLIQIWTGEIHTILHEVHIVSLLC